jgi:SAM-dependent methyltransferase
MKLKLLDYLVCFRCSRKFELQDAVHESGEVKQGKLSCRACNLIFHIENFIPRFVEKENYSANFGLQWNKFRRTQIDKFNGTTLSRDRFYRVSGWQPRDLKSQLVLEAGCGAGRFTQICLDAGAEVVSFDLSNSVDACLENHGLTTNLHLIQASIYDLPLRKEIFPYVFCLGVLQHTPNPKKSFLTLAQFLRGRGGSIAVDVYRLGLWDIMLPKRYLRLITKWMDHERLFDIVSRSVPYLLPISDLIGKISVAGFYLKRFVPVANIRGYAPLNEDVIREWAVLDTFDSLSPRYDNPQTIGIVRRWLLEAQLKDIEVFGRKTQIIARGIKQ